MLNQETLLELSESYLKSLVAETLPALGADFDASIPFGELGIDSFRVLQIIKALEADFGTLPKTLLFENFNVESLAQYFVAKHSQTLHAKFSKEPLSARASAGVGNAPVPKPVQKVITSSQRPVPVPVSVPAPAPAPAAPVSDQAWKGPIRVSEKDLPKYPEFEGLVKDLFELYKNEGCVSRGTRNIASNLFIGSERKGYFNYGRSKNLILIYAYTGPVDYFPEIAKEMHQYCIEKNFQLNIFGDGIIDSINGVAFSSTPFGALQRVLDIQNFTLEGSAMRRLRYQVAKFEKTGACRTEQYQCGTDQNVDKSIANMIDLWCATKPMVNPLIHIVREEILAGALHRQHRIFLTYLDNQLQNVILVSAMCSTLNGYLMDLEFYGKDMPMGGLEFAIVNIIQTLAAEGCSMLSMGGTYGCRLESSPNADPEVDKILDDLHKQKIFNDEGNLQFKNKFRPENKTIYLCRPVGSGKADNVIDIIMMIADPANAQTSEQENQNIHQQFTIQTPSALNATDANPGLLAGEARSSILADFGFNPLNIPDDRIDYDLKSDSWAQLGSAPFIEKQMAHLRTQLQQSVNVNESLSAVFPFKYFALTESGRSAENLFSKAWEKKGIVVENLLFPTGIYHQIDKGFTPHELPHPEVFNLDSGEAYKGNLNWGALQEYVTAHAGEIAYVCIEVSDNGAGGYPVSLQHLKQVKDLLTAHAITLVIDGTRILENAQYIIEHDAQRLNKNLWDVAKEILSYADIVVGSLAKDFCVNKGGLIATNDEKLFHRIQDLIRQEGGGLNVVEKKLIALAMQNRRQIESLIVRRMRGVETIWRALKEAKVPVVQPVGTHCVIITVKRLPEFQDFENPVASFLAWLYLNTGIRAGEHSVGMQKNTTINEQVRLAIPVGLKNEQVDDISERLVRLFREKKNIPELKQQGAGSFAGVHDNFDLVRYRGVAETQSVQQVAAMPVAASSAAAPSAAAPAAPVAGPSAAAVPVAPAEPVSLATPPIQQKSDALPGRMEIAVVGMAGRYPKAKNLTELWENLKQGKDCVSDIPQERLARRVQNAFTQVYRGGFIDDVDKFDSLFFNISPREAEIIDPQERLFLEVAWETLEDAGYYPEILAQESGTRNVGVFVGAVWAMYQILGVEEKLAGNDLNPNSFLWSIANRVSFWMNFTGPSLTVDTACSSSLTALYLACETIHNGGCSSAIVGGVNLDLHQHKFSINNAGGALSRDGLCRAFGAGANGYVASEGVGAIYIKPLAKALEDSDNIYAVIKSAVSNHGGRASGYTVPNPKSQGELVKLALEKAGVDAHTISYIEAHGTGTELGDPIEITGLTNAFESDKVARQSCAIGSVKTNIGHLEAAAGVVGICKVVLQMKYRQLVPSLHSSQLNEYIDFKNSPFYVQQNLEAWNEKEIDGIKQPLRAGVSSFGAGGANAHIVIENYTPLALEAVAQTDSEIFPLSARNDEQLREMAMRLRKHLEIDYIQHNLNDIAFTLQNGRKSFEHRLVVVAKTKRELSEKLGIFVDGKKDADVLSGHAKNSEGITKLLNRKEKEQFVALLSQSRNPHKLAQLWIDGLLSDCRGLPQPGAKRTSLPSYPFADKRHWISTGKVTAKALSAQATSHIHPLIDSNESTFQRQLFKKTFFDREFFVRDHVVSGVPTLPGTAYLDLARKAGEFAAGRKVQKIKNVTWVSPLVVEGTTPTEAFIELKPSSDSVAFEIFSELPDGKKRLYSQGKLHYASDVIAQGESIDLAAIRARCTKTIIAKDAYPLFEAHGMHYGPSFQVLQEVYKNDDEVLGLLKIPDVRSLDFDDFVLHPSILDAAMQAGVTAQLGDASGEMKVPYSLGEVEFYHPLTRTCYSYVTKVKNDSNPGSAVSRENVTIVDETGKVLVRIRESVGVPLMSVHKKTAPVQKEDEFVELSYSHVWQKSPLAQTESDVRSIVLFDKDDRLRTACVERNIKTILVLPGEKFEYLGNDTYALNPQDRQDYTRLMEALGRRNWITEKICYAWPESSEPSDEGALRNALAKGVYSFLFLSQALIEQKLTAKIQILYLYFKKQKAVQAHNEAINAFAKSLHLENPKIDCKVLDIRQTKTDANQVLNSALIELHADLQDEITVRYEDGVRYVRTLKKLDLASENAAALGSALKQHGVYLITGGAGGLGLIFAQFLAQQCRAKLVLTGRSELPAERLAQLDELKKIGAEVLYISADISKAEDVQRVVAQSKSHFGQINGIIHSAGVLRDSFLRNKTVEEMDAVFAPKIFGTYHLDQQTREDDLDFFVTFSSLAGIGGNMGQCDYAFANHYMDSFAASREVLRAGGKRSGRTLSLNWSLWADGGMKLDEQTELFFKRNLGIMPLRTELGLHTFVNLLPLAHPQVAVLEAVQAKIELAWGITKKPVSISAPATSSVQNRAAPSSGANLGEQVTKKLSQKVMELLKLGADEFSLDDILLDLGFDSIGLTTFANAINDMYHLDINPVLFFEYPSLRAIGGVLATDHTDAVEKIHSGGQPAAAPAAPAQSSAPAAQTSSDTANNVFAINKGWQAPVATPTAGGFARELRFVNEPIAIVGIAGVMPQSNNVEEFWDNLKNSRNMVTEIPRDRWIWEDYHGNPVKERNKSNSKWGGFMKEVDKFDPLFFGMTPREAEMMDPQQRIFIETVWSAIEDSGHKVSDLSGTKTGVFVGVSAKDYIDVLSENQVSLDGFSASGNSHSILANRISFLFNLRGPSAPLDTACSSSLVALHRAIESIHTGSSDMGLVGGVQVMLTPIAHISLSSAGMLSVDGKCKTFDKSADGYVRGEGSGVIFIKKLSQAEADADHIYAIIKATAENHGGRVTMLTAPNPKAQAELLFEAYEKAQIDPTTVGYIECHGTGTSLGDPIEIQALKKSFSDLYKKHNKAPPSVPHCGLSAVKTNIGHLEPAAGIASLLKVLLSIKYKYIPALLHFETLNPYIDLQGSPFYIVNKTTEWHAPTAQDGTTSPRRAGVSSFGWGGANAHVVLEEYLPPQRQYLDQAQGAKPIIISARNEERLKSYARSLLAHVKNREIELADLAYTLQVGRDVMDERLGLLVSSVDQLVEALDAYLNGKTLPEGAHRGKVRRHKRNDQGLSVIDSDDADARGQDIAEWIATQDFSRLLAAWVNGADVDWNLLHASQTTQFKPRRISLPSYPFARDRHWIDTSGKKKAAKQGSAMAQLHPLLHSNTSTLKQHSYSATFTGKESFLIDHERSLPPAAYLEMARVAIAQARPSTKDATNLELRNTEWGPATVLSEQKPLTVSVFEGRNGQIEYEIHSAEADAEGGARKFIHCQGTVAFDSPLVPSKLDVDQIKALMGRSKIDAAQVDEAMKNVYPNRGPSLRAIKTIYRGDQQNFAHLVLPATVESNWQDYVLHPSIVDGALQCALALATNQKPMAGQSSIPSGLESLRILAPCTSEMYAWARYSRGSKAADSTLKLDVDLIDSHGTICIKLKALSFSIVKPHLAEKDRSDDFSILLDSIYRSGESAPSAEASGTTEEEFEHILEKILKAGGV